MMERLKGAPHSLQDGVYITKSKFCRALRKPEVLPFDEARVHGIMYNSPSNVLSEVPSPLTFRFEIRVNFVESVCSRILEWMAPAIPIN